MNEIEIFCLYDDELSEYETHNKGYRNDLYVKTNSHYYQLNIYSITRLQQDFQSGIEDCGLYSVEPNLIIVKEVTIQSIKSIVFYLYKKKYFEEIKPVGNDKILSLELKKVI